MPGSVHTTAVFSELVIKEQSLHIIRKKEQKMSLLDLECQKSVSSSKDCLYIDGNKEYLRLGCDYQIYLSFSFPPYSCLKYLKQAKLILFKIPAQFFGVQTTDKCDHYSIYPLLDFFSPYSCIFTPPAIDFSRKETFEDNECSSYTEADITPIVKAWINEEVENKGILLTGNLETRLITYASDRYIIKGLHPFLRLNYVETDLCQPYSTTPCTIEINTP